MAEILGVVASGINIASLAGSILKVGFKTSELLKEVQQYPTEIAERLQDLQLLALNIGQSEKAQPALPSQPALEHARLQCQRCLSELQLALEDFSTKISQARGLKRSITVAKVVLKRDTLDRIERRLKHAFDTLMLAHQVYVMYVTFSSLSSLEQ
ncbi:hypothetical protein LX36DRAFT_722855 [Colletotrichum falcatum]|nr:hypothetical protein LX36DRAFT_722855 [Colletotrichum falcatum]